MTGPAVHRPAAGRPASGPSGPALAAELLARAARDQQVRGRLDKSPPDYQRWREVDADNLAWLKRHVADHGWPGPARVGELAASAAWLLVQHADHDWQFQRDCLRLLRDGMARQAVPVWQVVFLADRVFASAGAAQPFGTQRETAAPGPAGSGPAGSGPAGSGPRHGARADRQPWWDQATPALTALRAALADRS
ncbi:DUF6624 domain-containing protein [Solwaraspora sp. WMMB335]|uniref:DUF6624 domain-containing protein n=1 Tax=Solwaraspora sp. WMMB335 TaxID=3404118 RepID=UPI003B92B5B3